MDFPIRHCVPYVLVLFMPVLFMPVQPVDMYNINIGAVISTVFAFAVS